VVNSFSIKVVWKYAKAASVERCEAIEYARCEAIDFSADNLINCRLFSVATDFWWPLFRLSLHGLQSGLLVVLTISPSSERSL